MESESEHDLSYLSKLQTSFGLELPAIAEAPDEDRNQGSKDMITVVPTAAPIRKTDPILVQRWSQDTESFLVFNPKEEAVAQLSLMVSQSNNKLFKDAFEAMNADN